MYIFLFSNMFLAILFIVAVVLFFYLRILKYERKFNEIRKVYPPPLAVPESRIFGQMLHCPTQPDILFKTNREVSKDNKGFGIGIPILGHFTVHITNAEDAEVILKSRVNLEKAYLYHFLHDWLGTGLLTSTDKKWHFRRKMLTPAFHFSMLHQFVVVIVENTERLIKDLEPECGKYQTNITKFISHFALCTICETSMGTQLYRKSTTNENYFEALRKIVELQLYRFTKPWLYMELIFKLFFGFKLYKYLKILHNFTESVISAREKNFNPSEEFDIDDLNTKKRFAMLDLLIKEKRNNKIDFEGVREEVDTFMFEGHDTVSMALNFTLLILANHSQIQEKILKELREIYAQGKGKPTYQDLQNMAYLEMCIKESLRLCPSVPGIGRTLTQEVTLKGTKIPAGTEVWLHIYDLHRDSKYFPNPEIYDPERFSPQNIAGRNPFAFVPFSAGPRNCIGQKFAMLEMKIVISEIIWNYIMEPVQTLDDMVYITDIILRTRNPSYIKFKKRIHD